MSKRRGRAARNARRAQSGQSMLNATALRGKHAKRHAKREERKLERLEKREAAGERPSRSDEIDEFAKAPHSFVFHRGRVGKKINAGSFQAVRRLVRDMRGVMEPYTASKLKALRRNNLKDFVVNATPLGVTHLIVFSRSSLSVMMRVVKLPHGPTMTFKVLEYVLSPDVISGQRHPIVNKQQQAVQPLVVIDGFSRPGVLHKPLALVQSLFQNMFPPLKVDSLDLKRVRRCALLSYSSESDTIDFRHYGIKNVPCGVSRSMKKLLKKKVPDLGKYEDVSEFLLDPGQLSESDVEPAGEELVAPIDLGARGCYEGANVKIRLSELGPRLKLELVKIEDGISDGEVLYHKFVNKTPEQVAALRSEMLRKRKLKEHRRREQELNVLRKMKERESQKQRCADGMKRKYVGRVQSLRQKSSSDEERNLENTKPTGITATRTKRTRKE